MCHLQFPDTLATPRHPRVTPRPVTLTAMPWIGPADALQGPERAAQAARVRDLRGSDAWAHRARAADPSRRRCGCAPIMPARRFRRGAAAATSSARWRACGRRTTASPPPATAPWPPTSNASSQPPPERPRPGSYSWPDLRRNVERRYAAGAEPGAAHGHRPHGVTPTAPPGRPAAAPSSAGTPSAAGSPTRPDLALPRARPPQHSLALGRDPATMLPSSSTTCMRPERTTRRWCALSLEQPAVSTRPPAGCSGSRGTGSPGRSRP